MKGCGGICDLIIPQHGANKSHYPLFLWYSCRSRKDHMILGSTNLEIFSVSYKLLNLKNENYITSMFFSKDIIMLFIVNMFLVLDENSFIDIIEAL